MIWKECSRFWQTMLLSKMCRLDWSWKGKDGVKQGFTNFYTAAPDFKVEPKSLVTHDMFFALEVVFTGTQKEDLSGLLATGKRFSVTGCSFGEFENGKVKGRRDYWDSASLAKQLRGEP
jgi:steroid delta-isomerase-like uncharacterized protein